MSVDPVCGMTVAVTPRSPLSEHRGVVYSFCTVVCKQTFEKEPERFLGVKGKGRAGQAPASAARARELGRLLRALARQLADPAHGKDTGMPDLAPVEQLALLELGERGRVMMSELAQECGLALSTMTGLVDRLETKGYVLRARTDADRRVVHVELTGSGQEVYQVRLEAEMRIVIALLDALSTKEQGAVVRALGNVVAALEE